MQKPKGFRGVKNLHWVRISDEAPPFVSKVKPKTGARARGVSYERRAHEAFRALYGARYIANPWIRFNADGQLRWAQPDALLFDFASGVLTIIEYKYQHTYRAWWQLTQLYLPLIRRLFPERLWEIRLVEVTKWYDPATPFPGHTQLLRDIEAPLREQIGVHIWKPGAKRCKKR